MNKRELNRPETVEVEAIGCFHLSSSWQSGFAVSLLVFKKQDSLGLCQCLPLGQSFGITQWVAVVVRVEGFRVILLSLILSYRPIFKHGTKISNKYAFYLVFVNHVWTMKVSGVNRKIQHLPIVSLWQNVLATSVSVRIRKMVNYA